MTTRSDDASPLRPRVRAGLGQDHSNLLAKLRRSPDIPGMTTKPNLTSKRAVATAKVPASFLYRGVRIRWPQKPTKRTESIYAAARKVMNLGPSGSAAN